MTLRKRGGAILLVEDDERVLATLVRSLGDRTVRTATSATSALALLAAHDDWTGFLVDLGLPEGPTAGFALLRTIRETYPHTPAAVITGRHRNDVANRVRALDADLIMKGADVPDLLRHTLERIDRAGEDPIVGVVDAAMRRVALTEREAQLLEWFLRGGDARSFAVHAGLARTTIKDYQEGVLRKMDAPTPAALVTRLLTERLRPRR